MKTVFVYALILVAFKVSSQSITPYALNNGGGYSSTMEWSMGESVSIANFIALAYSLNTGGLTTHDKYCYCH
jgi:hypothetical protein